MCKSIVVLHIKNGSVLVRFVSINLYAEILKLMLRDHVYKAKYLSNIYS